MRKRYGISSGKINLTGGVEVELIADRKKQIRQIWSREIPKKLNLLQREILDHELIKLQRRVGA